jgi:hypothetical protein
MIIVSHQIFLKTDGGEIVIGIEVHKPEPGDRCWTCRYEINWPEGRAARNAFGLDALQSLILALQMIGAEIYASAYHQKDRLHAYEKEQGYGFPIPSSLRDMLIGADAV